MMSKQRVLIVEDEYWPRRELKEILRCRHKDMEIVGEAETTDEALRLLDDRRVDGVFLDIHIEGESLRAGMDLAHHLQHLPKPPWIVFTTGYADFAVEAYAVHPADYLVKPLSDSKVDKALDWVRKHYPAASQNPSGRIEFSHRVEVSEGNDTRVDELLDPRREVLYLCSVKNTNTLNLHLSNCQTLRRVAGCLGEWGECLSDYGFLRMSKSHLVNADFIARIAPHPYKKDVYQLFLKGCGCATINCRRAGLQALRLRAAGLMGR
jgi:DNA-binding LytR/AlgR family response regulator